MALLHNGLDSSNEVNRSATLPGFQRHHRFHTGPSKLSFSFACLLLCCLFSPVHLERSVDSEDAFSESGNEVRDVGLSAVG